MLAQRRALSAQRRQQQIDCAIGLVEEALQREQHPVQLSLSTAEAVAATLKDAMRSSLFSLFTAVQPVVRDLSTTSLNQVSLSSCVCDP